MLVVVALDVYEKWSEKAMRLGRGTQAKFAIFYQEHILKAALTV